jgi:hypothetical protein
LAARLRFGALSSVRFFVRFVELAFVLYSPNPDSEKPAARFVICRSVWVIG